LSPWSYHDEDAALPSFRMHAAKDLTGDAPAGQVAFYELKASREVLRLRFTFYLHSNKYNTRPVGY
jgi:hypothetical protein